MRDLTLCQGSSRKPLVLRSFSHLSYAELAGLKAYRERPDGNVTIITLVRFDLAMVFALHIAWQPGPVRPTSHRCTVNYIPQIGDRTVKYILPAQTYPVIGTQAGFFRLKNVSNQCIHRLRQRKLRDDSTELLLVSY